MGVTVMFHTRVLKITNKAAVLKKCIIAYYESIRGIRALLRSPPIFIYYSAEYRSLTHVIKATCKFVNK